MGERDRRDLALDLMRGYFLFVILVDHLRFARNPLYYLSGNQSLWVTAAGGFVLVSGFLVGKLRGGQARARGFGAAARHILRRAAVLALWSAILTIAYRVISETTGYWPDVPNADEPGSLVDWIIGAVTLRRTYGDHNLLAAYALFLLVAPLGLLAMLRGRTLLFLGASALLWAASFRYWLRWSNSVQADACWQFLFYLGMAAGFHEEQIVARWAALSPRARRTLFVLGAAASATILAVSAVRARLPLQIQEVPTQIKAIMWHRERLGLGRIVCDFIVFTTMYAYVRRFEDRLVPTVGKVLIPLGQNSLYVYIVQSMLTFAFVDRSLADPWAALAMSLGLLAFLWILVRYRVLFGIIPR